MKSKQYGRIVQDEIKRVSTLRQVRDELDLQIDRSMQLIYAVLNMLPDAERETLSQQIEKDNQLLDLRTATLTDAIRSVLKAARGKWLTVAQVRDRLKASGFDFSGYASNPLASVSTTLRRMKSEPRIDSTSIDGVTAYKHEPATEPLHGNFAELGKLSLGFPIEKIMASLSENMKMNPSFAHFIKVGTGVKEK